MREEILITGKGNETASRARVSVAVNGSMHVRSAIRIHLKGGQ